MIHENCYVKFEETKLLNGNWLFKLTASDYIHSWFAEYVDINLDKKTLAVMLRSLADEIDRKS